MDQNESVARVEPATDSDATSHDCGCGVNGRKAPNTTEATSYVYAIGQIETRFPSRGMEREIAQVVGRTDTRGKTNQQTLHSVLSERRNRYLLRQLCWVLNVQGLDTYLLQPRDPADFDLLLDAISPTANHAAHIDVIVGMRVPVAPPPMCGGLMLPVVVFDQVSSFAREDFINAIPRPDEIAAAQFAPVADELFQSIMQMTGNTGAKNEHRALNYLAVRYPAIYEKAAEELARNSSLTGVEVRPSPLSTTRSVVEVIFSHTNRTTDYTQKSCVRCDVTEEFPFLVTKLSPYYDHIS